MTPEKKAELRTKLLNLAVEAASEDFVDFYKGIRDHYNTKGYISRKQQDNVLRVCSYLW